MQKEIREIFEQLRNLLVSLHEDQYTAPCATLSGASIGQHLRHILELFICLEIGYHSGIVNYDKRKRDIRIETDREFAKSVLEEVLLNTQRKNKVLLLESGLSETEAGQMFLETNFYRELLYNIEHAVHHMALIRIGVASMGFNELPEKFGVAASTMKYRKSMASAG